MNAASPFMTIFEERKQLDLAIDIATEHVDDCLRRGQRPLDIMRVILGPRWTGTFRPTRGQVIEAYARAWLELGVG